MSKHEQDEKKQEKDEKELNKHEEKSMDEKGRSDPLGSIVWALILIWAGVVFLANNLGWLDSISVYLNRLGIATAELPFDTPIMQLEAWSLFFIGAGALLLGEVIIRLLMPAYRRPVLGAAILSIVFFGLGLGTWNLIWPLILIVVGLAIVLGGLFRRRS